ncbi:MAG: hypothetical protein KBC56_08960 [Flavobacterium sp.]|nr:hypothetical protein [Flavobacterium sp.]
MYSYELEYHYRYANFQKDFEVETIEASSLESAKEICLKIRRWTFSVYLVSVNGVKCDKIEKI